MIVVIGSPIGRLSDGVVAAAGTAARVALSAAGAGRTVQLVGKIGDDPTADAVIIALAQGGVGHVALLRDGTRVTRMEPPEPEQSDADDADTDADVVSAAPTTADGPSLDAGDVDLGLRYLTEFAVIVVAEPVDEATVAIVAEAARWGDARMIIVVPGAATMPDRLPTDVVVFEAPDADPDGVFADMVGRFAAGLDDGTEPGTAFRNSIGSVGWTDAAEA